MLKQLYYLPFYFLLSACSTTAPSSNYPGTHQSNYLNNNISHSTNNPTSTKLLQHFNEWQGVRYKEGGLSKSGIDCSGFVHLAYKNKLNKSIARTTERLSQGGKTIHFNQLRSGDLVFFKTGWKQRHVGIYMGNGKFMHASSSRGVMMSRLSNPYWSEAYWMARRY